MRKAEQDLLEKIVFVSEGSGRGLVVKVLDSGLKGRRFDPHTGHGSLLKLRQFHIPRFCRLLISE